MAYKITDPSKYSPLKSSLAHLSCGNHPLARSSDQPCCGGLDPKRPSIEHTLAACSA